MDQIEEHKRVKDNQSSKKGKTKVFNLDRRDNSSGQFTSARSRRDFFNQASRSLVVLQAINSVFKESIYRVLKKIKSEPYFKWLNKMGGDPTKRN